MITPPDIVFKGRYRDFTLRWQDMVHLAFYGGIWTFIWLAFSPPLSDIRTHSALMIVGAFGLWRYSWWMLNFGRSQYYGRVVYPALRRYANLSWLEGWRPRHVHFVMTTFHEHPWTTAKCLESIFREVRDNGLAATLWIGTGADMDERVIRQWLETAPPADVGVNFVRQNQPGKRIAIGLTLRALSREFVHSDDIAILLDGDSVIMQGCLQRCLSLMGADPKLKALTTDEEALCIGPQWLQKWLTMRFAQRRMWMQSHSLSRRVLTLTGRFSVFRAPLVVQDEFIRLVESDHLNHWFWGDFRFLSGDDKSTWYYLLRHRCDMLFVPDALVYTIERVEGKGLKRALDNTLRWSGNMLRNGMRAILLGPQVCKPYIWWCLIDQRLTIWTTLAGFLTALSTMLFIKAQFFFTYVLWIMGTRFCMSSALFFYSRRIHVSYPFILYCNQLTLAFVKVWLMFRLPQQRWANRLDQRGIDLSGPRINRLFPLYQNGLTMAALALALLLCLGVLRLPDVQQLIQVSPL
ncbi:MAG: glycosyltransferase [Pseudomonadota bacterium]|nr:glycosyltransferase [Pseudomonadota bacterium]